MPLTIPLCEDTFRIFNTDVVNTQEDVISPRALRYDSSMPDVAARCGSKRKCFYQGCLIKTDTPRGADPVAAEAKLQTWHFQLFSVWGICVRN